jgi:Protein of unknown function (DUF2652)
MSDESTKQVLLMIADISGYTEFIVSTDIEIEHSQKIITQLINTIIEQIKIPLEISKLEGDAVFLYAIKNNEKNTWQHVRKLVGEKLLLFFEVFHDKLTEMKKNDSCSCGACSNIDVLKLKIVIHSGEALFYYIQQFYELSGKDVILIHRLTKNSVASDEYILMTESAYSDIDFPSQIGTQEGIENYEHFGDIKTLVYYPQ